MNLFSEELIVDNFAGGGGASTGIYLGLGRHPDIAVNHDPAALAVHTANHPATVHLCEDVFAVDPGAVTAGRPVGFAWFSPDCKDFSKAKGGKPRRKKIRGLAWVMVKWAAVKRPRVMVLENVEEFQGWGPLLKDGSRCPDRIGNTFRNFVARLKNLGYVVEWKELRACDYGAPTIRKRLFLIARCDGRKIVWPAPSHGSPESAEVKCGKQLPWETAAECIDWSIPCPSIFERKRPLAEATLRRIARGIRKFVIDSARPFIVKVNHSGSGHFRGQSLAQPLQTITAKHGWALATPFLTEHANASSQRTFAATEPLRTQCAQVKGGHFAVVAPVLTKNHSGEVAAFLAKHFSGVTGSALGAPVHTVTATDHNAVVMTHLAKLYGTTTGQSMSEPMHTVTGGGNHLAEVRAFLIKYYGEGGQDQQCLDPMHTIPTKDRIALVTVEGEEYVITDIGMRMLEPHELYAAQGFPRDYIIAPEYKGRAMAKHAQVRMCGNSVCPPIAAAIAQANVPEMVVKGSFKIAA